MSRAPAGDVIETKPTSNVFTALVAIAFLAELIAFIALYLKAGEIFIEGSKGLFG
jgi:hypothetical protein